MARDLLAAAGTGDRGSFLKRARSLLGHRRQDEIQKLSAKLGALGVDWSPAPTGKVRPVLHASFAFAKHDGFVDAGETIALVGTVTNSGTTTAHRVHAQARSANRLFDETEWVFGKIEPGENPHVDQLLARSRKRHRSSWTPSNSQSPPTVTASARNPLKARVRSKAKPVFSYAHQLIDDGNRDGPGSAGRKLPSCGFSIKKHRQGAIQGDVGDSCATPRARICF